MRQVMHQIEMKVNEKATAIAPSSKKLAQQSVYLLLGTARRARGNLKLLSMPQSGQTANR